MINMKKGYLVQLDLNHHHHSTINSIQVIIKLDFFHIISITDNEIGTPNNTVIKK